MLARRHRLRTPDQFRAATRRGGTRRASGSMVVVQLRTHSVTDPGPTRVGFVVSKAVGDAVTRNRVKRILRHAVAARLSDIGEGQDIVIRALPTAARGVSTAGSQRLRAEVDTLIDRVVGSAQTGPVPMGSR